MTIKEILNQTKHRPWQIPAKSWKFYQEWNDAIFLHWQVDLLELQEFVPRELEIDLFEGKPWVSVVAFTMENIRPKNIPSFAPISNFNEINVRTYVKFNGKAGVYFLSIEGGTGLSCKIAKWISDLPYRYSTMKRSKNQYASNNAQFHDTLDIKFLLGNTTRRFKDPLGKWLTERYVLFQDTERTINEFEIHHIEWPIQEIKLAYLIIKYPRFSKLIKSIVPDKIQYSKGVKVLAWGKNKIQRKI